MDMRGLRRHRTLIGWAAIVALLGNVIGGLFCAAPAKAYPSDYPPELAGAMVICTEHGEQMLPSAADDEPKAPSKHCPLCLAAAGVALLLTFAALWWLMPLPRSRATAFDFFAAFADGLRRNGLGSRAPPLSA
jgi:hypothetical protein